VCADDLDDNCMGISAISMMIVWESQSFAMMGEQVHEENRVRDLISGRIQADCYDTMEVQEATLQSFESGLGVSNFALCKTTEAAAAELGAVRAPRLRDITEIIIRRWLRFPYSSRRGAERHEHEMSVFVRPAQVMTQRNAEMAELQWMLDNGKGSESNHIVDAEPARGDAAAAQVRCQCFDRTSENQAHRHSCCMEISVICDDVLINITQTPLWEGVLTAALLHRTTTTPSRPRTARRRGRRRRGRRRRIRWGGCSTRSWSSRPRGASAHRRCCSTPRWRASSASSTPRTRSSWRSVSRPSARSTPSASAVSRCGGARRRGLLFLFVSLFLCFFLFGFWRGFPSATPVHCHKARPSPDGGGAQIKEELGTLGTDLVIPDAMALQVRAPALTENHLARGCSCPEILTMETLQPIEEPERVLSVEDSEISAPKWISPEQQAILDRQARRAPLFFVSYGVAVSRPFFSSFHDAPFPPASASVLRPVDRWGWL
jgi:hypothetical protein